MFSVKIYFSIFVIFFLTLNLFSQQEDSLKNNIPGDTLIISDEEQIEELIESQSEDAEDSKLLDRLSHLKENPIDLNSASATSLEKIPYINSVIAENIIQYRTANFSFKSISDLLKVDGIDKELYIKIQPYVRVTQSKSDYTKDEYGSLKKVKTKYLSKSDFSFNFRCRFTNDLQPSDGYYQDPITQESDYNGSRPKIYNRLKLNYRYNLLKVNAGLITEKDAGEEKLFDFISGYGELKTTGIISQFVAGDYTLEFGQGITLWSSFDYSKGNDAVSTIKKKGAEIEPYRSVNEVQFFRGAAARFMFNLSFGELNTFGFWSDNYIDASVDTSLNQLSSIYYDGYHRTDSELNRDGTGKEKLFGGRIELITKIPGTAKFGLTYYQSTYSTSFKYKGLYTFSGNKSNALGFDYDILYRNINFFGEWARSYTNIVGGISGVRILSSGNADVVLAVRNYPKNFIMLHSYGFGEQGGSTQNEFGIYAGVKIKIPKLLTLNTYFDQYKFPYSTYEDPTPTIGNDFLLNAEWKFAGKLKLITKYKNENKEDVIKTLDQFGRDVKRIYTRSQSNYRAQVDYEISNMIRVKSRFEYVFVSYDSYQTSQKGILFYTDVKIKPLKSVIIDGRYIVFQTDSYDSRIYEYESELDGVISNQGLYGKGRRWYLLVKYKPFEFLHFSAKYSETYLDGVKSIGSGNDEINNDIKNKFAIQLEFKY